MNELLTPDGRPALRWCLFALASLGAVLWARGRVRTACLVFVAFHLAGLGAGVARLRRPVIHSELEWGRAAVAQQEHDATVDIATASQMPATLLSTLAARGVRLATLSQLARATPILVFATLLVSGLVLQRGHRLFAGLLTASVPLVASDYPSLALRDPQGAWAFCVVLIVGCALFSSNRRDGKSGRASFVWFAFVAVLLLFALSSASLGATQFGSGVRRSISWGFVLFSVFASAVVSRALPMLLPSAANWPAVSALALLVSATSSPAMWWAAERSVPGFVAACETSPAIDAAMEWIRQNTPGTAVFEATDYSEILPAATGRRVLLVPSRVVDEPNRRMRLRQSIVRGEPDLELARRFGVTHVFLGPGDPRPRDGGHVFETVYTDARGFAVLRILAP